MTSKWPSFVTKDLGDTEADAREMERRWQVYNREMQSIIAAGGVHQDDDGWWVDDTTGELIGPDPELERPLTEQDFANMKPFKEVHPELYESIQRARGRPPKDVTKKPVTLRLDPDVIEKFKATGKGWQGRMNEVLRNAKV